MNRIITHQSAKWIYNTESIEKGCLFEEYVKNLFNQKNFLLKKWNKSQRIDNDTFIEGLSNPDLELVFVRKNSYPFAVECKWQQKFYDGKIGWAKLKQIAKYEEFQKKRTMPVFIVIGIGGKASNPEKLFVTPLDNIKMYTDVYEHQLIRYKRKPTHKFFYDTVQLKLF